VDPEELRGYIVMLERACVEHPQNADFRTCLGMAHAMNFDVYKSMDALEEARRIEPDSFFAQLKYSELYYRLRALLRAEEETLKAVHLAGNAWELSLARKQLAEIRRLKREGTQKPAWTKPLSVPVVMLVLMTVISGILLAWK
jgi:cytochrome c-type biogenesis protein CcmH/NrfG